MRPHRPDDPCLSTRQPAELPLTGRALLELMRAVLARGIPFRFRARGWSMSPFIRDGDVITISPLGGVPARTGEVVAFEHAVTGGLVVHRVVARRDESVLIRGDAAKGEADGYVPAENIIGRVTRIERAGRTFRLGLGPERRAVALLSRSRMLTPLVHRVGSLRRALRRRGAAR